MGITDEREQSRDRMNRPPFKCPWASEGCEHVTVTNARDHHKHVAQHEREELKTRTRPTPLNDGELKFIKRFEFEVD